MPNRRPTVLCTALVALTLAGCGPSSVVEIGKVLEPARPGSPTIVARGVAMPSWPRPRRQEFRDRDVRDLLTGSEVALGLSASRNRLRIVDASGCRSTRPLDWFSPSTAWEGCGTSRNWHTAEAEVTVERSIYPLQVGARGRYTRRATSHTGRTSERTTECRVRDAVTVDLGLRRADAFEVRCDDGRIERTTWYSPGEGPIAYREAHVERGLRKAWVRAD
ncbi:MAG: hypothetical protein AAF677_15145 [Pseudomonadota bacterium]